LFLNFSRRDFFFEVEKSRSVGTAALERRNGDYFALNQGK